MQKTKTTIVTKVITFILSMLILFYAVPSVVYSETIDALSSLGEGGSSEGSENSSSGEDFKLPLYEVEELREENAKHFKLSDGSYVAAQYNYPVHYDDGSGKLLDIDNALAEGSGGVYANKNARVKFAKKITGNESLFTLHDGNTKLTFSLIGAEKGTKGTVTNGEDSQEDTELQKMMNLEKLSSSIIYTDILDGVDLEYVVESLNIKENVIVKEKADKYTYTFEIKLNGLTAALTDSGDIEIKDVSTEEVKYVIPAPVIYDAEGVHADRGVGSYALTGGNNGKYTLVVSVSSEWMNAEERAFPVTVDPTVKVPNSSVVDLTISSSTPNTVNENETKLYVSDNSIAYWKTDTLPEIPRAAYITSATITLRSMSAREYEPVCAYEVTSSWDATNLTWNTHNASAIGRLGTQVTDYEGLTAVNNYTWDITKIVRKWYAGKNYGVALHKAPGLSVDATFHSSESATASYAPTLTVCYRGMAGIEDYWAYSSHSIGVAGSGSINLANGNLVLEIPTLSTTDSLMPYTPTLVYNSLFENMPYIYPYHDTANQMATVAYGFKLNIAETLLKKSYTNNEGISETYYVYADADGTEHVFYVHNAETNTYMDENGLQKQLTVIGNSEIQLTDDSKTVRTFLKSVNTYSNGEEGWYLSKITDRNGNSVIFTYDATSTLRPQKISMKPNRSSSIDFLEFYYYSSGRLQMIYNSTSKDAVVFRYSATPTGTISTTGSYYLRQIDYAHGNGSVSIENWNSFANSQSNLANITVDATASYEYVEYNGKIYLYTVSDNLAKRKIEYGISDYKVRTVKEIAIDTETGAASDGQDLDIFYSTGVTDVASNSHTTGADAADYNTTRYVFDMEGRCTSVYSFSTGGTEIYGATVGEYETQSNVKNNLKEQTVLGGSAVNYILNGGFEESNFAHWERSGSISTTYGYNDKEASFSPQASAPASLSQYIYLEPGEYTLSFPYITRNSDDCAAFAIVKTAAGDTVVHSEEIPLNPIYNTGIQSVFSTTFKIDENIGSNRFKVIIKLDAGANKSSSLSFTLDDVMLENNIGASNFSYVRYGNFQETVSDATGNTVPLSNYWSTNGGEALTTVTDDRHFGKSLKLTAKIDSEKYVKQRVYQADSSTLDEFDEYPAIFYTSPQEYIVSGFAKATAPVLSERAKFRIIVDVLYYQGRGDDTLTVSHYFDFEPACTGWQFTAGSFSTEHTGNTSSYTYYSCVYAIDVYCEYSYQADGYALFDDISFTEITDRSKDKYCYYKNGLLAKKANPLYTEYYEYDGNRNLTRVANNKGEISDYFYTDTNNVDYIIEYTFTYNNKTDYPFSLADPDAVISKTAKFKTEYTYNIEGLTTSVVNYPIDNSLELADGSMKTYVNYRYDTAALSKTFGALIQETNSLDVDIYYFYDSKDGKLLATVNSDEGTGVCYTYDEMGNLTGVMPATWKNTVSYNVVQDAENVSYTYNERNLLSTITTESTTYTFTYDVFGNTTSVKAASNVLAEYTYNERNGKLNKITYGDGLVVEYVYDALELLTEIWYTKGTEPKYLAYEYEYTADGQVYKFADNVSGKSTVYKYDVNNRLLQYVEYDNDDLYHDYSSELSYNTKGELSSRTYYLNHTVAGSGLYDARVTHFYTYETDGRLQKTRIQTEVTDGYETYTYDGYKRVSRKVNSFNVRTNTATSFTNQIDYTFSSLYSWTSSQIASYTSTVNGGTALTYTYTYDQNGNITKVVYNTGAEIRYVYDDLSQLIREDNGLLNKTYVYSYDNAGNITSKKTYALTAAGTTPTSPTSTYNYGYSSGWGDMLISYRGVSIYYDAIGNPLSYYNGSSYTFSWTGRQLTGATKSNVAYSFTYNDEGIRTSKTKGNVTTTYYLDGSRIVAEETSDNVTVYLYDSEGLPIGMQYRAESYANDVWDAYWYERNLQGDVVAVYNSAGTKLISYTYDAWGNTTVTYHNGGASTTATKNPFRYRGYYYDVDLGLYYLNTRYYDANTGRFINADGYVSTGQGLLGYNMYAYCSNNPIMLTDISGEFPWLILGILAVSGIVGGILGYNSDTVIGDKSIAKGENPEADKSITDEDREELSTGDKIKNTIIGTGLGIATGGAALILLGSGAALFAGSATTTISFLGATGAQTVATGALAYNVLPILIAPFFGAEIEPLEFP